MTLPGTLGAGRRAGRSRAGWHRVLWVLGIGLLSLRETASAAEPRSFRVDVLPLLTKAGCNAGACHGAATGQGGFRLSLLGYDPEEDHRRITRELGARRVDFQDPAQSLLLLKGSGQVDHEGGRRLRRGSEDYESLRAWISAGVAYGPRDQRVTALEATPGDVLVSTTNQTVQVRVMASLSDGSRRDVTSWALYSANDDSVAEVDRSGLVTTRGSGLTSVTVRYSGQVASVRVAVPFPGGQIATMDFEPLQRWDRHILAELQRLRVPPSVRCDDGEFLRRVFLDLAGRLPSAEVTRAFLTEDESSGKRVRVVEELLQSEAFVDCWTLHFADLLLISGKAGGEAATRQYHGWLRAQIASNTPMNRVARELLTASGELTRVGPANFYTLAQDPRDLAEHVGRIFLGTQIGCARCHAHPTDQWTQEDYHRFAAYFARVTREGGHVRVVDRGEVADPKSGVAVVPKPLGGEAPHAGLLTDRRVELADWLTARGNPFFARALVNRVWKLLLGRGLVEPVDDLRATNPATHPELLRELADSFVSHGFDLRWLVRSIVTSRTYQGSVALEGHGVADEVLFSRVGLRELSAQVFADCVAQVSGVPDVFDGYPAGTRAVQLVGTRTVSPALDVLGRCLRERACDTPGRTGGGLARALHLINGSTINEKLVGGVVAELQGSGRSGAEVVEELYLRALIRRPTPAELSFWEAQLQQQAAPRDAVVEDLLWTLLNSREFAFNH